jgi:hypothetical protein
MYMQTSNASQDRKPGMIVYAAGLLTSAATLAVVDWLADHGIQAMGFFVNLIIPAGAILVGLCSGAGYAIGSRLMNVRVAKGLLVAIALTTFADYLANHYMAYLGLRQRMGQLGEVFSFWDYFREMAEGMSFKSNHGGSASELGKFGYFFLALEAAGFVLGSLVPLLILKAQVYCPDCQRYLVGAKSFFLFPSLTQVDVKTHKGDARQAFLQEAMRTFLESNQTRFDQVIAAETLEQAIDLLGDCPTKKTLSDNRKLPFSVQVIVKKCPTCAGFSVEGQFSRMSLKYGDNPAVQKIFFQQRPNRGTQG